MYYPRVGDDMDFKFIRTEDHNFTITAHTNQQVEFFYSLLFALFIWIVYWFAPEGWKQI